MTLRPPSTTLFPYTTLFRSKRDYGQNFSTEVMISPQRFPNLISNHNNPGTESPMQINRQIWQANSIASWLLLGVVWIRSEEHTSELQSPYDLVCRLLLEKKK